MIRTLKVTRPRMTGADVKALQTMLTAKGWPVKVDSQYGDLTADAVRIAKKKIPGYPPTLVNRSAGAYFIKRLTAYTRKVPAHVVATDRTRFVALLEWGLAHEPPIHYKQWRPIVYILRAIHYLPLYIDCSAIGILFAKWAKCKNDPSGYHFIGLGNTSSFLSHCRKISKAQLKAGDIVQFDNEHATYVLNPTNDPLLFSHGMERGPIAIPLSEETKYHRNVPIYYLRFIED